MDNDGEPVPSTSAAAYKHIPNQERAKRQRSSESPPQPYNPPKRQAIEESEEECESDCSTDSDIFQEDIDLLEYGPRFRRQWRTDEMPMCILGVTINKGELLYLVRLIQWSHNEEELAIAEYHPYDGIDETNLVIAPSACLRKIFPEMIIRFYEEDMKLLENAKSERDQLSYAATVSLYHQLRKGGVKLDGTPIFESLMGQKPKARYKKRNAQYLNSHSKRHWLDKLGIKTSDRFGLPRTKEIYKEDDEVDQLTSSDNSTDEEHYLEVAIANVKLSE